MTCIAGIAEGGKVWIGGDSAGVAGYALRVRADEKVFVRAPFAFGFTSSFRMGDLLRYAFTPPEQTSTQDDRGFLATSWMDALRNCLASGGFRRIECGVETGGTFLLGYRGALYIVGDDFQVGQAADGYDAVGCGHEVAIGSLYSSSGDPRQRVLRSLQAAERHNTGVRGPFNIVVTGGNE